ncbi:MAG TPA: hypothetical protein VGM56_10085 [Byssovorax sp.]
MSASSRAGASKPEVVHARDLAALLSSTLGWEKSEELVTSTAHAASLDPARLTRADAIAIFDALSAVQGIVGVTARFARSRIDAVVGGADDPVASSAAPVAASAAPAQGGPPRRASVRMAAVAAQRMPVAELAALLAASLGQEKAHECVTAALQQRGIVGPVTIEQATSVFDDLGRAQGIVGVAARFAKARIALRFGGR